MARRPWLRVGGVGFAMDPPRYLGDGDVVRIEVEGLGAIEHAVEAAPGSG